MNKFKNIHISTVLVIRGFKNILQNGFLFRPFVLYIGLKSIVFYRICLCILFFVSLNQRTH